VNLDCGPLRTVYRNSFLQLFISRYAFFSKKDWKGWATVVRRVFDHYLLLWYKTGPKLRPNTVLEDCNPRKFSLGVETNALVFGTSGTVFRSIGHFLVVRVRVRRQVLQVSKVKHMERKIQMKSSTFC